MDAALIEAWREAVADDETIVCLGDISAEGYMHVGHEQMWNAAPGRKHLVLGNHDVDRVNRVRTLETETSAVVLLAPGDPNLVLTHVPLLEVPVGCVNVHGHLHEKSSPTRDRHINVSVEQLDYRPVRMTEVRRLARRLREQRPSATCPERPPRKGCGSSRRRCRSAGLKTTTGPRPGLTSIATRRDRRPGSRGGATSTSSPAVELVHNPPPVCTTRSPVLQR